MNIRYVLTGKHVGWAALYSMIKETDEGKVRDAKEDIDTVLVFAGLFSAVLTAFVIESYKRLSPDSASQTLAVMKQISLQIANSTYHPLMANTPPQAFQPSNTDICVNALWFASLILSLTTASIGILVKQWLREYLSLHNPSPRARLRIRHYREPELRRWKVFEIAAVLPFLQQLSLALFFVGLCYFSASVHKTVGRTSLSLVVGWAFFICTVTILPLFFPRCPY
ncbi:hypothetical protein BC629DRAFT_1295748, partial [Irpex lacteus]